MAFFCILPDVHRLQVNYLHYVISTMLFTQGLWFLYKKCYQMSLQEESAWINEYGLVDITEVAERFSSILIGMTNVTLSQLNIPSWPKWQHLFIS